jgi:pyruvate,water dikinase
VVYRFSDFKTNEYRNLKGGESYEPFEENPMIGYRGCARYIAEPEIFALESKPSSEFAQNTPTWAQWSHSCELCPSWKA